MYSHTITYSDAADIPLAKGRILWPVFGMLAVLVLAVRAAPPIGAVFGVIAALYALRGPKESVEALTILAFMLVLGKTELSMVRWLVIAAAGGRVLWDTILSDAPLPRIMGPFLVLCGTIFVLSLLASYYPTVSIFKLLTFVAAVGTAFTALHRTASLKEYWNAWFLTLGVFIFLASMLLIPLGLGYGRNGEGFQGILTHPQTFGPLSTAYTALITGLILFERVRSKLLMLAAAVGWAGIYMSQSRTALLALILGLGGAILVGFFKSQTWQILIRRAFSGLGALALCLALLIVSALFASTIERKVTSFLLKDDSTESVEESLSASRSGLIERSLDNFRTAPITGIGFGVPSEAQYFRPETGFLGLPVSASVEKGFMPSAVLEETGVTGAVLVVILLVAIFIPVVRWGTISHFWMMSCCVLINLGEMVFFSVGFVGLFFWLLLAYGYTCSLPEVAEYEDVSGERRWRSV